MGKFMQEKNCELKKATKEKQNILVFLCEIGQLGGHFYTFNFRREKMIKKG